MSTKRKRALINKEANRRKVLREIIVNVKMASAPPLAVAPIALASAVTDAQRGNFSGTCSSEMVVIKHNVLQFYRVGASASAGGGVREEGVLRDEDEDEGLLVPLCPPTELSAPPLALCVFRPPGRNYDVVALAFTHTHMSVVALNPSCERVDTIAAVLLRDDPHADSSDGGLPPFLRYDAERDLIAMYFCSKWLAIIQVNKSLDGAAGKLVEMSSSTLEKKKTTDWGDEDDEDEDSGDTKNDATTGATPASAEKDHEGGEGGIGSAALDGHLPALALCRPQIIDCTHELKRPLRQVRDIQFVPSFSEPTLAILCEQDSSWAGRVKLADYRTATIQCKSLSCSVVWLSLSSRQTAGQDESATGGGRSPTTHRHAVEIGDVDGIPYSTSHMVPIPSFEHVPGGVVCFSHHSILHVTPKRRFGCYINKFGREEAESDSGASTNWGPVSWTKAPTSTPGRALLLSSLRCTFVADRVLLLCATNGQLLHFEWETDGRSIVGAACGALGNFQRPSCVVHVSSMHDAKRGNATPIVFLGTTEGDSVVVRIQRSLLSFRVLDSMRGVGGILGGVDLVENSLQPKREDKRPKAAATVAGQTEGTLPTHPYGPLFQENNNAANEFYYGLDDIPLEPSQQAAAMREIALCSGSGDCSSIMLCRDSIVSQVVHRNNIECVSSHVVQFRKSKRARDNDSSSDAASEMLFLLLSTRNASIVLRGAGDSKRLEQVRADRCAFATNGRTLFAGKGLGDTAIVQVTERDVMIVGRDGNHVLGAHSLRPCGAVWAAMWNQHQLLILYQDNSLVSVTLTGASSSGVSMAEAPLRSGVAAAAIHHDEPVGANARGGTSGWLVLALVPVAPKITCALELFLTPSWSQPIRGPLTTPLTTIANFSVFPAVVDSQSHPIPDPQVVASSSKKNLEQQFASLTKSLLIVELALVSLRRRRQNLRGDASCAQQRDPCPTLFIMTLGGECVAYKVLGGDVTGSDSRSPIRLIKKLHETVDCADGNVRSASARRETIEEKLQRKREAGAAAAAAEQRADQQRQNTLTSQKSVRRLVPFEDVAGYSGLYVCGRLPRFVFSRGNGQLISHRHILPAAASATRDGAATQSVGALIRSFTPVDASWLPSGFVCCCEGFIAFGTLPPIVCVEDALVITKRIPISCTPSRVSFCAATRRAYLLASTAHTFRPVKAPFDVELKILFNEDGSVMSVSEVPPTVPLSGAATDAGMPMPSTSRYHLTILSLDSTSPGGCQRFPAHASPAALEQHNSSDQSFLFDENEEILCSHLVSLPAPMGSAQDGGAPQSRRASLFVVGTGYPIGEDVACRGRLLVFHAVDGAENEKNLVPILKETCKGPVTAVTGLMGKYVVAAIGGTVKVLSLDWSTKKFAVSAFLFSGLYVSSLSSVHNLLLLGDLHRSCTLARFVESEHVVEVLARHSADVSVVANGFTYRGDAAGFLVTDDQRQLLCLGYQPQLRADGKVKESRLSLESGCRLPGGCVTTLVPMRCVGADGVNWSEQNKVLYTTNYGEIGFVMPVSEQDYRVLQWLTKRLNTDVKHSGGLPPSLFQSMDHTNRANSLLPRQRMIGTMILEQIHQFDRGEKGALCAAAGTTVDRVQALMCCLKEECSLH